MDDLKRYLKSLSEAEKAAFAANCGTTIGHLRNASYGAKSLAPAVCMQIERHSDGAVRRWATRPTDWHLIWPNLVGTPGAPKPAKAPKPLRVAA